MPHAITDGPANAEDTCRDGLLDAVPSGVKARRPARQFKADLTLVHVVDDDQPAALIDSERREANRFLREQIDSLAELRDVACRAMVTTGDAFDSILEAAKVSSADLIILGRHRKQLLRDVFVGTTIERVIRTGPYPVLMVNRDADRPYEKVLAAVDASELSAHALKTILSLGLLDHVFVEIVYAFLAIGKQKLLGAWVKQDQIETYVESERQQAAAELKALLAEHGLNERDWSRRIEEGAPFEAISRAVNETTPDLLVIGTDGRSGVAKLLLGSVAEEVLRSLDVDILAVPPIQQPVAG